jgi:predicted metalloprotease with PDZ domain
LGLVAHEFFHVWNVKRIRPDALGPFDYENENYTRLLWVAEGTTAYYEGVLMRRAGLISDKEFLNTKVAQITQLQERPGRLEMSLEEASFDAWIKYYRPDENAINSQVSYYDKGEIVNMMLDVTIRTASGGAKSLDDVLRYIYNEYSKKGKNYTPADFQKAAELAAGKGLDDFFAKYVRGRDEIDYAAILRGIGLQFESSAAGASRGYIGANLADEGGRLMIRTIPADTPAYEQGLNTGDQIVAVDGHRTTLTFLSSYINERKPKDIVKLTIFRHDRLREVPFVLGEDKGPNYELSPVAEPTEEQRKLYQQYLQATL